MYCHNCGFQNTPDAPTCTQCGSALDRAIPPAPGPAVSPPPGFTPPPVPGSYSYSTPPAAQPPSPGAAGYGYNTPPAAQPPAQGPTGYGYSTPPAAHPPAQGPVGYGYSTPPPAGTTPLPEVARGPGGAAPPPEVARVPEGSSASGDYAYAPAEVNPPPVPTPRKSQLLRNALLAVGLLALLGGAAVGYLAVQAVNKPNIAAARLLPPEVYGYLSINAQPGGTQKAALDKLQAAFKSQPGFQKAVDKITNADDRGPIVFFNGLITGCAQEGATPEATTAPLDTDTLASYLGNSVTLAMLPLSVDELNRLQDETSKGDMETMGQTLGSKVLFFVDLDFNPLNKKGLLPTLKKQSDNPSTMPLVQTYRGVDIRKLQQQPCPGADPTADPAPDIFLALIEGTAVLGLNAAPLQEAIDRYKDGKSLNDSPAFQKMDGELPKERLATFYLNTTSVYKTLSVVAASEDSGSSNPLTSMATEGATMITLSAEDAGLQVDAVSDARVNGQAFGATAAVGRAVLDDVPTSSWGFYAGSDLKTTITQAIDLYRKNGMADQVAQVLQGVKDTMGLDLEQEVLPLLGGDYLLVAANTRDMAAPTATPDPNSFSFDSGGPNVHFAVELRLQPGDGPKMNDLVTRVNTYLTDQGNTLEPVAVGTGQFWSMGEYSPAIYGVQGDKMFLFSTSYNDNDPTSWPQRMLDAQGQGLGTDAAVRARLARLPANANTVFYADLARIRTEAIEAPMDEESRAGYEEEGALFLRPLQYLVGGGSASLQDGMTHSRSVLFLGIGK